MPAHVETRQQFVQVRAAVQIRRQNFADFVVQDVALFLAHGHEPSETIVFILYCHSRAPALRNSLKLILHIVQRGNLSNRR